MHPFSDLAVPGNLCYAGKLHATSASNLQAGVVLKRHRSVKVAGEMAEIIHHLV